MPKKATEAQTAEYLQILRRTLERIAACVHGMDEARLNAPLEPGEWSVREILAHLRGCEDVWSNSIYTMLNADTPDMEYVHPRDRVKQQGYAKLSFAENFQAFGAARERLVSTLAGVTFEQWGRAGRFVGKSSTFTVFGEVRRMALHDVQHCEHLETFFSPV